jgi:hypothetical protein
LKKQSLISSLGGSSIQEEEEEKALKVENKEGITTDDYVPAQTMPNKGGHKRFKSVGKVRINKKRQGQLI